MNLTLHVWRQKNAQTPGRMVHYPATDISPDMSFLEMLDVVNEDLAEEGRGADRLRHDCREGICGSCCAGDQRHAARPGSAARATCQLHMRHFKDGDTIYHRAVAGQGVPGGQGPGGGSQRLRPHHPGGRLRLGEHRRRAGRQLPAGAEAEAGDGDGRGRVHRLRRLRGGLQERLGDAVRRRQGRRTWRSCRRANPERPQRVRNMVAQMDAEGFGNCTN